MSMPDSGMQEAAGPTRSATGTYDEPGGGWILFAGIMLVLVGVLNVIWGIAAIGDSSFFVNDQKYILSNLNTWGWVTLILGLFQLFAAFSLWSGGLYGRVFAIAAAGLSAIAALLSIPAYPFWSLAVFAIDIIIIHQVAKYGGAERDEAPRRERVPAA
jgi:hypothetical protein